MDDFDSDDLLNDPDFIIPNSSEQNSNSSELQLTVGNLTMQTTSSSCISSSDQSEVVSHQLQFPRKRKNIVSQPMQYARKIRRQHGEEYVSTKGVLQPKRQIKPTCTSECYFSCSELFPENYRQKIFKEFWLLTDSQKNNFYSKYVSVENVKRRVAKHSTKKQKTFKYYFQKVNDNLMQRVCQTFFLNTLSISKNRIYYHFKHLCDSSTGVVKELRKGKHVKHVIPNETKKRITEHIKSFPVIDSHYCRASTTRQYLEQGLTISKMFRLFQQKFPQSSTSLSTYSNIFKKEFNLGFFVPKKDQCDRCVLFQKHKQSNTLDENFKKIYEEHCREKINCKVERDKDRAIKSEETLIICFDLQSVFTLPKGLSSIYYYKRKLSVFNMTVTVCSQNKKELNTTYCAIWNEVHSGRSGNDIASAVGKILQQIAKDFGNVKHFILWSDSCVPQNKNQIFSTALLQFIHNHKNIQTITQKFSEPGHSQIQEVDSVHSAIDRFLKLREIQGPSELVGLLQTYKSPKVKLIVLQMTSEDFYVYSVKSKKLDFQNVPFARIKSLQYEKNNLFTISYKTSLLQKQYTKINIKKKGRKGVFSTPNNLFEERIKNSVPKKISSEKINDVKSLYNFLSLDAVAYYNNLFNTT